MKECEDCEYRGYSRQICRLHAKHCQNRQGREPKPIPAPLKIGAKTLAGVGIGMGVVFLGSAAVSLVGGAALLHAVLLKVGAGAGITGGGIGFYKSLTEGKEKTEPN